MTEMTMTIKEAAKKLRQFAELTAGATQNWDAYENICADVLRGAYNAREAWPIDKEGGK